jgi:hypothetical protein
MALFRILILPGIDTTKIKMNLINVVKSSSPLPRHHFFSEIPGILYPSVYTDWGATEFGFQI